MNKLLTYILLLSFIFFASCEERFRSETQCLQARFISQYCNGTSEPLYLVEFLSPTSLAKNYSGHDTNPKYIAAMLDFPESIRVTDTTFYMQIHHDPIRESKVTIGICTANFGPASILVCEGITQSCP